jgi:hypothetical protein
MKVKGPPPNLDDPASRAYQYNPVTRALALTDAELRTLFPPNAQVEIVRHKEGLTKDGLKAARGVLFPRQSPCHLELIVSDVVAIFPNPREAAARAGLIGSLLVGGNRVELIFTFRRFDPGKERPQTFSDREGGRLTTGDPAAPPAVLAEALTAGTSAAFAKFAANLAKNRRGR